VITTLVRAQLKAEIRDKTILARSAPFIGLVLLLFAFAFDPDRGILSQIAPGLWWVTTTFAAMFVFVRDAHHKQESRFISQFGIDASAIFFARTITNILLISVVTLLSGIGVIFFFSPEIDGIGVLISVAVLGTVALSAVGAIYAPLVAKLHDSGQLLSLVVIPIVLPALLACIQATDAALNSAVTESWQWTALLAIFAALFVALGALASDSLED
jgi:heme exporter protein B